MKGQTKHLTRQVREALLALPDTMLLETLARWLDGIDEQLLDWSDECRSALGYRLQSDETHKLYASFEELGQAEPEGAGGSWMVPDAQTLRRILGNLSLEQFYHMVIALASEVLALQASEEAWGFPPSVASDGYDFMRSLTVHHPIVRAQHHLNTPWIRQQKSARYFGEKRISIVAPPRCMLLPTFQNGCCRCPGEYIT